MPSLARQICVAHSWQGTVATVHQIYEQIICEKKLQQDDSVIVFYWNPQTYWDTYSIDFFPLIDSFSECKESNQAVMYACRFHEAS